MTPLIPHWIAATAFVCVMFACLFAPLIVDGVCNGFRALYGRINTDKGE